VKKELGNITVKAEVQKQEKEQIESLHDIIYRYRWMKFEQKERLYAVFINNTNQFIGDKVIGLGGRESVELDLQDVIRTASLTNAAGVIFVHNHPSGTSRPTSKDTQMTQQAHEVLEKINVEVVDHVIIAEESFHSMKQNGNPPF
jgi:DNA repair protein RadC